LQALVYDRGESIGGDAPDNSFELSGAFAFICKRRKQMFDLKVLFNTLKLPLGMVAVIVALLAWAA